MRRVSPATHGRKALAARVLGTHSVGNRDQEVLGTLQRVELPRRRRAGAEIRTDHKV